MKNVHLTIIDPQVDFCDPDKGSLYVKGAEEDMQRLSKLIDKIGQKIKKIHVTLDCHHSIDVAHPCFWVDSKGANPAPFTIITADDVKNGKWIPVFPKYRERMVQYVEGLESSGRYPLCVWPPHCLIGSEGNNVMPVLFDSLIKWEKNRMDNVDYVTKGSNPLTEHYSAVKAEIPDPQDTTTQLNTKLIQTLMDSDKILIAGEAGSHCVRSTVEDIVKSFNDDSYVKKMVLIEDAISPVQSPVVDFPAIQSQFITNMKMKGMQTTKTTDF